MGTAECSIDRSEAALKIIELTRYEGLMSDFSKITVKEASRVAEGDLLIKFSDDTVVLFHAKFLYDVRNHGGNVQIVDPFKQ